MDDPLTRSCVIARRPISVNPLQEARELHGLYRHLAHELRLGDKESCEPPLAPYNLLLTQSWMALIRRRCEKAFGFSINALGFAGYLLATEKSDQDWMHHNGSEALLRQVVSPLSDPSDDDKE